MSVQRQRNIPLVLAVASLLLAACGGDDGDDSPSQPDAGDVCAELAFAPGEEDALQDAVNSLTGCATITLTGGTYSFQNAITIRADGVTFAGAGKGGKGEGQGGATSTVLDFTGAAPNTNGLDVVGKRFVVRDLAIWNARKDGLRIESSTDVKIQRVRTEWASENAADNGAYGIYPVSSENVLIEDCEAYNASDAGIYVGQTLRTIVRRNVAKGNVAGIEIENTLFADVHDNLAEDNTCGLVVFDLPGNPRAGSDIFVHDNTIKNNNRANFASVSAASSTVSQVPAGTGTFVMASRRVEITGNTYENNNSVDVAVLSGLAIEDDLVKWAPGGLNYKTTDVWIHGNTFLGGSGDAVDNGMPDADLRPLGALIAGLYAGAKGAGMSDGLIEHVVWDGIDPQGADDLANEIHLCADGNTVPDGTKSFIADLNFVGVVPLLTGAMPDPAAAWAKTARVAQGVAPFDCGAFTPPLDEVVLP